MHVRRTSSRFLFSWAAAVALVAVLFQSLASGAMAHTIDARGVSLIVCSADGATAVTIGADGKAPAEKADASQVGGKAKTKSGLPCQDCVGAATAVPVAPPAPAGAMVRYARQTEAWRRISDTVHHQARAPPRPPSRAPPTA